MVKAITPTPLLMEIGTFQLLINKKIAAAE